ncbi:hypothetical protein Tco_1016417 [Tanacetum coccineum]|uniref:Reverse transcriptase n=1 Tax=Tanacetum coccineum TaxID=301880 RepID=A0ABQ5FNL9_9ASTR
MAPAIRTGTSNNLGDGVDPQTKNYVDAAMNEIRQSLAALTSTIAVMGGQNNQMVNPNVVDKQISLVDWQRFVFEDPMAALKNAKYEKNTKEYQDVIDTLLCRIEISQEHVVSLYLGGLPTELEMSVRMFKPRTLANAYYLTNLQESTLEAVKKKNRPIVSNNNSRYGYGNGIGNVSKLPLLTLPSTNNYGKVNPNTTYKAPYEGQLFSLVVLADELENDEEFVDVEEELWILKGETFTSDVMLLPVGGCDMVLGIQWLATLGDIKCNFQEKQIQKMETGTQSELMMLSVYPNTGLTLISVGVDKENANSTNDSLQEVIKGFKYVFEVPKQLPLARSHDHKIPLLPRTKPINIRPYRHLHVQKDAIESMMKELLEFGVIKHSQNSFASLVVMVKKKDNTWRICVDYRVKQTWEADDKLKDICVKLKEGQTKKHYSWVNDLLLRKGKLVVGYDVQLRQNLLHYFHDGSISGHSGVKTTTHKILDRLNKYAHFVLLTHPFIAVHVAQAFLDNVCKLHAIKTTPFKALFGQPPPVHVPYIRGMSIVDEVDKTLVAREKVLQLLKFHLERAQNMMKHQTDKIMSERVLEVGDWNANSTDDCLQEVIEGFKDVFKVPKQLPPARSHDHKIPLLHGTQPINIRPYRHPYVQKDAIESMVKELLESGVIMHSQSLFPSLVVMKCKGNHQEAVPVPLPQIDKEGLIEVQPMKLVDRKMVKRRNDMVVYGLIQWTNGGVQDATRELLEELCQRFPEFDLDSCRQESF